MCVCGENRLHYWQLDDYSRDHRLKVQLNHKSFSLSSPVDLNKPSNCTRLLAREPSSSWLMAGREGGSCVAVYNCRACSLAPMGAL